MVDQLLSQFLLFVAMGTGAAITALWVGLTIWTWRDMRMRSRDTLAQVAATVLVGLLSVFGLIVYLMLRPRETLAEAYERSLEEEALLQSIEEKPTCPGCGRHAHARWQVCPHCFTRLKRPCTQCGELLDLNWALCPYCATQQAKASAEGRRSRRGAASPASPQRGEDDGYPADQPTTTESPTESAAQVAEGEGV
jgi:hypothetical protein